MPFMQFFAWLPVEWFLYRKFVQKMVQGCSKLQKMCFLTKLVQKLTNYGTVTPAQSHDDLPYSDKSHCQCGTRTRTDGLGLGKAISLQSGCSMVSISINFYLDLLRYRRISLQSYSIQVGPNIRVSLTRKLFEMPLIFKLALSSRLGGQISARRSSPEGLLCCLIQASSTVTKQ